MVKVKIVSSGVACHSGYPELGRSAIDPIVDVLQALKSRAWPANEELGETTMNIGLLQGGQAANALAEACEAVVMFRLVEAPEPVLEAVEAIAREHGCSVQVGTARRAVRALGGLSWPCSPHLTSPQFIGGVYSAFR